MPDLTTGCIVHAPDYRSEITPPISRPLAFEAFQAFDVEMRNEATGEVWLVRVDAADPAAALSRVLRRKRWAEALLSEQPHRFVVKDVGARYAITHAGC